MKRSRSHRRQEAHRRSPGESFVGHRRRRTRWGLVFSPVGVLLAGVRGWAAVKRPVLSSVLRFGLIVGLLYVFLSTPWISQTVYESCWRLTTTLTADACGAVLRNALGQEVTVTGPTIAVPHFSVIIVRGCDGVEVVGLFCAMVLSVRVPLWPKLVGLAVGVGCLLALNVARIVGLFCIGQHFPSAFEFLHLDVGQVVFIFVAISLGLSWARWATHRNRSGAVACT